jgi:hypothetical protein
MSEYRPTEVANNGYSTADSGYRAVVKIQFVESNLKTFAIGNKLTNNGWRALFELNKPRPSSSGAQCSKALL